MADKFIIAGLDDEKSKSIAEILNNKTARKILDYLADNEATETQIASALKLPASTVNYNIGKLLKANIIEVKDFYWSPKGNKVNIYRTARKLIVIAPKYARGFETLKSIIPAIFIGTLLLAIIFSIIASQQNILTEQDILEQQSKLKKFSSLEELKNFVKQNAELGGFRSLVQEASTLGAPAPTTGTAGTFAGAEAAKATTAQDYSTTNIQVAGVDEADIVKNDGKYIYLVSGNRVIIVDAFPAENAKIVSEINLSVTPTQLFVNKNRLIIFAQEYSFYPLPLREIKPLPAVMGSAAGGGAESEEATVSEAKSGAETQTTESTIAESSMADEPVASVGIAAPIDIGRIRSFYTPKTSVFIYDISERENPVLERNISLEGNYFNSRMIEDYVYAIVNKPIYNYDVIQPPVFIANGIEREIPASEIYYFDVPDSSYIFSIVTAINLETGELTNKVFMTGYTQNMYVSQDNIYIIYMKNLGNRYYYDKLVEIYLSLVSGETADKIKEVRDSDLRYYEKFEKIGRIVQGYAESLSADERFEFQNEFEEKEQALQEEIARETQKTVIQKISINKDKIEHVATGEVPGTVLNQFSMDEYKDNFRIATTTQFWFRQEEEESKNNLYVLNENLEITGKLEGLAEGESIYSARFLGDKAYLVTFRQVDPLFVIDLSNPQEPKVLGFLKIPGVSDYLHPYDENYVIGVGMDATEEGIIKGLKISLFDASNPAEPKEVSKYFIGGRGTSSEVLNDHKAFLFSREKNLLVIPVTVYDEWSYKFDGAYVFNIDKENGFTLKGTVTHQNESQKEQGYVDWFSIIRRSLYMENTLYTVSQRMIKMNSLDDLSEINKIQLPYKEEPINYRAL